MGMCDMGIHCDHEYAEDPEKERRECVYCTCRRVSMGCVCLRKAGHYGRHKCYSCNERWI